jgi:hypothetical protein
MVAKIDTCRGRLQLAGGCGLVTLLIASLAFLGLRAGYTGAAWVGGGITLLGGLAVTWALLHPARQGLPALPALPRSSACRDGRHAECEGPKGANDGSACSCECHVISLAGERGVVVGACGPRPPAGRVRLGDRTWPALAADGYTIPTGVEVFVRSQQGQLLFISEVGLAKGHERQE